VRIAADPYWGARTHAGVISGEIARTDVARRREHRPSQYRSLGNAEVEPDLPHHAVIGHDGPGVGGTENAGELVNRADQEADRAGPAALQHAGLDPGL